MDLQNNFTETLCKKWDEVKAEFNQLGYEQADTTVSEISDTRVCNKFYFDNALSGVIKEKYGKSISYDEYCKNIDLVSIMGKFVYVLFASQFLDSVDANPGYNEKQYITAFKTVVK
jgi:hypothetical protein